MKFEDALSLLKKGRNIKLPHWQGDSFYYGRSDTDYDYVAKKAVLLKTIIDNSTSKCADIMGEDIMSDDWLVCDDDGNICNELAMQAEEEKPMESAERIEITFKSGETISYGKGEWDDYAYDGKAVIVKKNSTWIGIYNFDDVFCVELKEK